MKYTPYTTLAAFAATTLAASAANLAQSGEFDSDIDVFAGDYWQSNGTTTTFSNDQGLYIDVDADRATIIQKGAGTSILTINGGFIYNNNDEPIYIGDGAGAQGTVTMNGSSEFVSPSSPGLVIIGHNGGTGLININDEGLVVLGSLDIQNGAVNFSENSTGMLLVENWSDSDYQDHWDSGTLTYNGQNNGDFDDHFEFIEDNGDRFMRAIVPVPEPSTSALFGIAGLALLLRRHK